MVEFHRSIGNSFTAEIMAAQDYDSVTIDVQHGALDYSAALPMLQAMRASGKTLLVRVPWNEPGIIMKARDGWEPTRAAAASPVRTTKRWRPRWE